MDKLIRMFSNHEDEGLWGSLALPRWRNLSYKLRITFWRCLGPWPTVFWAKGPFSVPQCHNCRGWENKGGKAQSPRAVPGHENTRQCEPPSRKASPAGPLFSVPFVISGQPDNSAQKPSVGTLSPVGTVLGGAFPPSLKAFWNPPSSLRFLFTLRSWALGHTLPCTPSCPALSPLVALITCSVALAQTVDLLVCGVHSCCVLTATTIASPVSLHRRPQGLAWQRLGLAAAFKYRQVLCSYPLVIWVWQGS